MGCIIILILEGPEVVEPRNDMTKWGGRNWELAWKGVKV